MARLNFFERMEREVDFQHEYRKIEDIMLNEPGKGYHSINDDISESFRKWSGRGNFTSFYELRQHLGFTFYKDLNKSWTYVPSGKISCLDDFLLYCEMLLNMFYNFLVESVSFGNKDRVQSIIDTIQFDVEKIGHEIINNNGKILILQKNAAATAVADIVTPELGDSIIEYNHHLLKGDIETKKAILKKIADALEPKRADLKATNKNIESNFFYMVNNMNVRHNNCDPADEKRYNAKFALLSAQEKEEWYDEIYQEGLMAFLALEHVEREKKIVAFKW